MRLSSVDVVSKSGSSIAGTTGNATTAPDRQITCGTITDPTVAEAAADFESVRSRLFGIAYQMLGGVADAEDVVQDVWVRWQGADRAQVRDRVAFLVTITTRVALNVATSARARREVSVGGRLPERDFASADPAIGAERSEALELAVQLLIERLSPVERAVYVLHEAFGYPFREIAEALELSEANARQLASRARKHLAGQRHSPVDPAERDGLLKAFLDAARAGDMARLIDVLTDAALSGPSARTGVRAPGHDAIRLGCRTAH
jgi:RNA polymerase sigma factor (sigma-70 family)